MKGAPHRMEETAEVTRYFVDLEGADAHRRSMSMIIAGRKCHACRQADTAESVADSDPQEHIARIAEQCASTADYLLQDTPLKEATFRELLVGGNQPMSAAEVSEALSARWTISAYPRDLSPGVIGRLLDHSETYSIVAIPPPVEESDEEGEPPVEKDVESAEENGESVAPASEESPAGS